MKKPRVDSPIKILIVDDQSLFATGLRLVLEHDENAWFDIIGVANNGVECLHMLESLAVDVILMDVYMPEMDGVETTRRVHQHYPAIHILMLTTFEDDTHVHNALQSGASGYVLKTIEANELVTCIKAVHQGLMIVSPSVGYRTFAMTATSRPEPLAPPLLPTSTSRPEYLQTRFPDLKPREAEILALILKGYNNHEIGEELFIAEQTVRNYVSTIYAKIGVDDRLHAINLLNN